MLDTSSSKRATFSVIAHQYQGFCVLIAAVLAWAIIISVGGQYNTICESNLRYQDWTFFVNFAEVSVFYVNITTQIPRLWHVQLKSSKESLHVIYIAAFIINAMAGTSSLLQFVDTWGGLCESGPQNNR